MGTQTKNPRWLAAVVVLLVSLGCSSASEGAATGDQEPVATTTPVEARAEPTPAPTVTVAPEPTPVVEPEPQSQSAAEAERDGVAAVVADLTFRQRVEVLGEVEAGGDHWVISRIPAETIDDMGYAHFVDAGVDTDGGELLQLDGDRIERAVPMPSSRPTWIVADGSLVFAGRQGDGGQPSSSIVRVDASTGDATRLWLPASYANRGWDGGDDWQLIGPDSRAEIWPALTSAIEAQGADDPATIAAAVQALDAAVDQAETYDPALLPRLALTDTQCGIAVYSGLLFDYGTVCVAQQPDDTGTNPIVLVGTTPLAGNLVGAGRLASDGPILAAIVEPAGEGSVNDPLVFVDIMNPDIRIETGVTGRDEGSELQQVSFFEDGFIGTWAVDLTTRVVAFDAQGQPVSGFVSPTDRDLGYPPDPAVTLAMVTTDGQRLAFIEREWPRDGSGWPGTSARLVVTDTATGAELTSHSFELATIDFVRGLDFTGRWALVSVIRYGEADPQTPPPVSFMIDTETGTAYPLGVDSLGIMTFDRSEEASG